MRRIVTREGLLLIRQQAGRPITIADVQAEMFGLPSPIDVVQLARDGRL